MIKDSGARTEFTTGAVRDIKEGKGRVDLIPSVAILRLSRHFEEGAKKYGEYNWQKGIPTHSYIDSALRHIFKYLDGQTDEDHLCAAAWNLICCMWTEEKKPEMQDIPTRIPHSVRIAREVERMKDIPASVKIARGVERVPTTPLKTCGTCKHFIRGNENHTCHMLECETEENDRVCVLYELKGEAPPKPSCRDCKYLGVDFRDYYVCNYRHSFISEFESCDNFEKKVKMACHNCKHAKYEVIDNTSKVICNIDRKEVQKVLECSYFEVKND